MELEDFRESNSFISNGTHCVPYGRYKELFNFAESQYETIADQKSRVAAFKQKLKEQEEKLTRTDEKTDIIAETIQEELGVDLMSCPTITEYANEIRLAVETMRCDSAKKAIPLEPIKIADSIISAKRIYSVNDGTETVLRKLKVNELRQIAEHILVYCNAHQNLREK